MARRSATPKATVPPTISPLQAIPLLRRQIERLDEIIRIHYNDPKVDAWENTTENILNGVYGMPNGELHGNTYEFRTMLSGVSLHVNMSDPEIQRDHTLRQQKRKALLEAIVEQLQDLAPPSAATAPDQYRFHPEIERVAGQLYRDGHYKAAALEAYIRVIEEVRTKSGLALAGC